MSSSDVAISIQGLSKKYVIGTKADGSLRGTLANIFNTAKKGKDFWALKDISFDIKKGEVVGIIGKNGAGKSTILKVLSQITGPTEGRIEIEGRVASLLEVGTGFHPELTGRENIYLNGTILGMSRKEVKAKFDEIVAFSGVEKFIDTAVKHYSSGMYVRLAFAVAAHLEPEILIIDEVLAVGDASFQKKCLGKMEEVAKHGRTVIFVSHDMGAVASLCDRGILLEKGQVKMNAGIQEVIDEYMGYNNSHSLAHKSYKNEKPEETDGKIAFDYIQLIDSDKNRISSFYVDQKVGIEIAFIVREKGTRPVPNVHIKDNRGTHVFTAVNSVSHHHFSEPGDYKCTVWIPTNFMNNGIFTVGVAISTLDPVEVHVADYNAIVFETIDKLDTPNRNGYTGKIKGMIRPTLDWDNE